MPAARYWRAVGLQSVGGGALELSALHLHLGGVRVDAAATLTSAIAPAGGSLAALQDDDTATTARWLDVSAPGFALVWDFGAGNTQDVAAVWLGAGATYAEWLETLTLQYSSDGVVWATLVSVPPSSWPGANILQPAGGDPHFDKVSLLLHMDGVNGSTVFKDETGKNVSAFGAPTPVLSTAQAKFGQSSLLVNPTGTTILSGIEADSSADFDFGGDDFTVEWWQFWANPSSPRYQAAFQRGYNVAGAMTLVTGDADGRYALFLGAGGTQVLKESTAGATNAWVHYALVRAAGVFTLWRDGEASASGGSALTVGVPNKFAIGCYASDSGATGQVFNGYIDEFRVTKGVARYTANFIPPTLPFPDVAGSAVTVHRKLGVKQSALPILLSGGSAGDTVMTLPPDAIHLDRQDANGAETNAPATRYRIPGPRWVKEKTASTNVPLRRRVQLYNQRDSRLVREVWSDPVTGEYSFDNIRGDTTYFVIAFDHTGHYRAVIADNLTPEPIP